MRPATRKVLRRTKTQGRNPPRSLSQASADYASVFARWATADAVADLPNGLKRIVLFRAAIQANSSIALPRRRSSSRLYDIRHLL